MAATHLVDMMCNFDCTTTFLFINQLPGIYIYDACSNVDSFIYFFL